MKKFWLTVIAISFSIAIVFASIGIINFVQFENTSQTESIEGAVSADIFDLQTEMSELYLVKEEYLAEQSEINTKLDELSEKDLEQDAEAKAEYEELIARLNEIEELIEQIQSRIDSLQASIDELYSSVEELNRNVVTFGVINGGYTFTSVADYVFPLTAVASCGNKISLSNNTDIVVGKNTSQVLVSFNMAMKCDSVSPRYSYIYLNGAKHNVVYGYGVATGAVISMSSSPILINVKEGDILNLVVSGKNGDALYDNSGSCLRTWITVEVVA